MIQNKIMPQINEKNYYYNRKIINHKYKVFSVNKVYFAVKNQKNGIFVIKVNDLCTLLC